MTRTLHTLPFLLWAALCVSCRQSEGDDLVPLPAAYAEPTLQSTPGGHDVLVPEWLDRDPALRAEAFAEIDAVVPGGWRVVIRDPGAYGILSSPTGLARGHTDYALTTGRRHLSRKDS